MARWHDDVRSTAGLLSSPHSLARDHQPVVRGTVSSRRIGGQATGGAPGLEGMYLWCSGQDRELCLGSRESQHAIPGQRRGGILWICDWNGNGLRAATAVAWESISGDRGRWSGRLVFSAKSPSESALFRTGRVSTIRGPQAGGVGPGKVSGTASDGRRRF